MAAPTTRQKALEQAALGPKSVTVSQTSQTTTARDLAELQEAVDRETANVSATKKGFGLRFQKLVPPGAG